MNETFNNLPKEKKAAIIDGCLDEFVEYGYENASTNRIVQRIGISKGSLFKYFSSKEDLYAYILDISTAKFFNYMTGRFPEINNNDFMANLRQWTEISMEYYKEFPKIYSLFMKLELNQAPKQFLDEIIDKYINKISEMLLSLFSGTDEKKLRYDKEKTFQFVQYLIIGYKYLFFSVNRQDEHIDEITSKFMEGLDILFKFIKTAVYKKNEAPGIIEAGLDILYTLMVIDKVIHKKELQVIMKFFLLGRYELEEDHLQNYNTEIKKIMEEMGILTDTNINNLQERFENSADYFLNKSSLEQRTKMMDYAIEMILADGVIRDEEKEYIDILGETWGIDTDELIKKRTSSSS